MYTLSHIRADWAALALSLLRPTAITNAQLQLVCDLRNRPCDEDIMRAFCNAMPLTVARVPRWASKTMTLSTIFDNPNIDPHGGYRRINPNIPIRIIKKRIDSDVKQIDTALFGTPEYFPVGSLGVGLYKKMINGKLHRDYASTPDVMANYLCRMDGLPILISESNNEDVVTHVPLNDMVLLAGGRFGNWHRSSPVPQNGTRSAFYERSRNLGYGPL